MGSFSVKVINKKRMYAKVMISEFVYVLLDVASVVLKRFIYRGNDKKEGDYLECNYDYLDDSYTNYAELREKSDLEQLQGKTPSDCLIIVYTINGVVYYQTCLNIGSCRVHLPPRRPGTTCGEPELLYNRQKLD